MAIQTTTRAPYTHGCGQELEVVFIFHDYVERPVFYLGRKGYRKCPKCGRRLVYRNPSIV
jgi:hypothetical protein